MCVSIGGWGGGCLTWGGGAASPPAVGAVTRVGARPAGAALRPGPPYSIRPRCLRAASAPGGAAIYREAALKKDF